MEDKEIQQYNQKMKEKIGGMILLNENEVITKFKGIRLVNEYEKEEYLKYLEKERNFIKKTFNVMKIFVLLLLIFIISAVKEYALLIQTFILIIIIEGFRMILKRYNKTLSQKILNGKLYIADCYAYEVIKRIGKGGSRNYYIKVTDNVSAYLEEMFSVDFEFLKTNNDKKARLYVIEDDDGRYYLNVCTERMLKFGRIV